MELKLRVANIIEESRLGGPQMRIALISKAIKKNVLTTVIMPKSNSSRYRELLENNNINYKLFNLTTLRKDFFIVFKYILFFPYEIYSLYRHFKEVKYDLIHVSGGVWQYKGIVAAFLASIPSIWHINDTQSPLICRYIFFLLSRITHSFIFASNRSYSYYNPFIRKHYYTSIIQAPVDTKKFIPLNNCLRNNDKKLINIGTVCNPSPVKDLVTFIKAAYYIQKSIPNTQFFIIGNHYISQKNYINNIKNIIKTLTLRNVHFIQECDDVRKYLSQFDLYICTSENESSPLSVWESMSMGIPIVSTDVGDVPVFIENDVNGFISQKGDFKYIAKKSIQLINDDNQRIAFSKNCRLTAIKYLDIDISAQKHINHYRSLLD